MATELFASGTGEDLDDVFEPRLSGDASVSATQLFADDNGEDLADRFAPISVGTGVSFNTDLFSAANGDDLRFIFCAKDYRDISFTSNNISASCFCQLPCSCQACESPNPTNLVGGSGDYEYRVEYASGTNVDNTNILDTWLSSPPSMCRTEDAEVIKDGTFLLRIRDANNHNNTESKFFSFETTHSGLN